MSRIKFILIDYLILLITNLHYHVALLKRKRYAYDDDDKKEIITIVIINLNIFEKRNILRKMVSRG